MQGLPKWQNTIGVLAMHFLIGFVILCFIIAVPELRAAALVLIGLAGAGLLVVVLLLSANKPAPAISPPPVSPSQIQAAQDAAAAADAKAKRLIGQMQIEIRRLWLTDWDQRPIANPGRAIWNPTIHAVVRNNAPGASLTRIGLKVDLFDCPFFADAGSSACDQIGSATGAVAAIIPAGQVREMDSPGSLPAIDHLPPLRGRLTLRYAIDYICGSDGAPRPADWYLVDASDLACGYQ
jgi:hypothetical protein